MNLERSRCAVCGGAMVVRKTTTDRPYRYDLSGLDNVLLVGIEVRECQRCRAEVPIIPKVGQLHRTIAKHLVFKNALLNGKEIRFLRKNAGLSNKKFAALLEIDESHLSRVENGKIGSLGATTDKLARAIVEASTDGQARKVLLDIAEKRLDPQLPLFSLKKDHWEKIAA